MNTVEEAIKAAATAHDGRLYLDRYHSKNEIAFLWNFQEVLHSAKHCYFWTLTPEGYMSDRLFALCVQRFIVRWKRWGQGKAFKALRIFEPFQSGFLHCHFVVNGRFSVKAMRRIAWRTGIGRIHVHPKPVTPLLGYYLCKYMGKNRAKLGKGLRTWAKWGQWQHTLVRNVEVESEDSRLFRDCYQYAKREVTEYRNGRDEKEITMSIRSIPHRQAWINAKVLFAKEKETRMRDVTADELEMIPF